MTDAIFVATAYATVLGGLALYVASIVRRARATRRIGRALEGQQAADQHAARGAAPPPRPDAVESGR